MIKITPFYTNYKYEATLANNLKKIIELIP